MLCNFWLEQFLSHRKLSKFDYFTFPAPRSTDTNCKNLADSQDTLPLMDVVLHDGQTCSAHWHSATGRVTSTFHGLLSYLLLTAASFETMELSACICRAFLVTSPTLQRLHLVRENISQTKTHLSCLPCFQRLHAKRNK